MVVLTSFHMPDTPVKYEQRNTRAVMDKKDLGLGTLYITERAVCWKEQGDIGFCLSHTHITLHAISTDPNVYPRECIYIMIDTHVTVPGMVEENIQQQSESDSEAESESEISELILVPGDPSALTPMYEALKECQELNPDPEFMDDEDEDIYEDADEEVQDEDERNYGDSEMGDIGAGGDTEVDNLANRLQNNGVNVAYHSNGDHINDDQFEDAD